MYELIIAIGLLFFIAFIVVSIMLPFHVKKIRQNSDEMLKLIQQMKHQN